MLCIPTHRTSNKALHANGCCRIRLLGKTSWADLLRDDFVRVLPAALHQPAAL